jgi:hypothetical protein
MAGSVVFALGLSSELEQVAEAVILIVAIVIVSAGELRRRRKQGRVE